MTLINSLELASAFSPLLPLATGIRKRPGLAWCYILLGLVSNLLISEYFKGTTTIFVVANMYVLMEFFVVSAWFFTKFDQPRRKLVWWGSALWVLCAYRTLTGDLYTFHSFCASLLSVLYMTYCMVALYTIMVDTNVKNVFRSSFFLFTVALLIYFSGMFMLFASRSYFEHHENLWGFNKGVLMGGLWMINSLLNIIQSLIFTKAFLVEKNIYGWRINN